MKYDTRYFSAIHEKGHRPGAMLPLVAFLLPVILIVMGFSVDLAYMQYSRMELRAAADMAARAAATELAQTDSISDARKRAKQVAKKHKISGTKLKLKNSDIEFGRSEPDAGGRWVFQAGGTPTNSVRVFADRSRASTDGSVSLFFGSLIGQPDFEPKQMATASFLNVDICLVLDRSTSMKVDVNSSEAGLYVSDPRFCSPPGANSRWVALDSAVRLFVATLQSSTADEQVSLVTYSSALSGYCGTSSSASSLDSALDTNLGIVTSEMDTLLSTV